MRLVVCQLAERTAAFARKIGCRELFGPQPGGPEHCTFRELPDGSTTGDPVAATEGWSVAVLPGEGCETAEFGLCRYPGIEGWKLTSWCKTPYAARHGIEQFLSAR